MPEELCLEVELKVHELAYVSLQRDLCSYVSTSTSSNADHSENISTSGKNLLYL
jgi:hypothetical protein